MLSLKEYSLIADKVCKRTIKRYDDELISFLIERMVKSDIKFANEDETLKRAMRGKACDFGIKKYFAMKKRYNKEFSGYDGQSHNFDHITSNKDLTSSIDIIDLVKSSNISEDDKSLILEIYIDGHSIVDAAKKRNLSGTHTRLKLKNALEKVKRYV